MCNKCEKSLFFPFFQRILMFTIFKKLYTFFERIQCEMSTYKPFYQPYVDNYVINFYLKYYSIYIMMFNMAKFRKEVTFLWIL